ncbi:MAG: hypothetical protein A4S09_08025 [Proteobacteria bacterium SG_bin7]|nr:MAG: hypothetical protein A4S09_08025 [Proteobacteria bacterium SG_bin7]
MKKLIAILALSVMGSMGFAAEQVDLVAVQTTITRHLTGVIDWKVGQELNNKITLMGMEGTMNVSVASETDKGYWLNQDISILGQNMTSEALISKEDGTIIELKVNGQKQTPPEPPEMEIVEMKNTDITVPAGKYACVYAKLKDLKTNQITEAWLNQKEIPINNMLKMITSQQGMKLTSELVSFKK